MDKELLLRPPEGRFIWVKCNDCGSKQIIFTKASTVVNCLVCGTTLAKPTGGKADIKAEIIGALK